MKVSIITVVKNRQATIRHTIESVLEQDYEDIEYILIDGGSTDNTTNIIDSYKEKLAYYRSEPDSGVYDALNKGLKVAKGDVIGFLHSDDFYNGRHVISSIVDALILKEVGIVFGDVSFVNPHDLNRRIRLYSSSNFNPNLFEWGWMPAHPSCFIKRSIYKKYGHFSTRYKIASDFELLLRFIKIHNVSYCYLNQILVCMRPGGLSNCGFLARWLINKEILDICRRYRLKTNVFKLMARYPAKLMEKSLVVQKSLESLAAWEFLC